MSVESLAGVLHHSRAKGTAKLVMVGIANHDGDGGAWPTVATLAKYANVTERNVQSAIAKLVSLGELAVHLQAGGTLDAPDHTRPNRYDVLVSCPPWCDRTTQHRDTRQTRQSQLRGVGSDTRGVSVATPGPLSVATPKPPTQPDPTAVGTEVQPARELNAAPCTYCGQGELRCLVQQTHWADDERHDYLPARVRHAAAR